MRIPNVSQPRKAPLDYLSVPLSAIGFGSLVYGLSTIGEGHGSPGFAPPWAPVALGLVFIAIFVLRQIRLAPQGKALLDLRTFRYRTFSVAAGMMGVCMMSLFGMIIFLPIYMQSVLGLGALTAGLLLLPGGLLMGLMAPAVGRAFDKIGARKLVIPGTLLVSAALWMMSFFGMETPVWLVLAAHVLLSLGLSLLFTPLFTSGLGSLPQDLHHYGSAVVGTIQQVCGAAGIALYVSVMSLYGSAALEAGAAAAAANAAGVSAAFATAAIVSVVMIAVSVFVRRPKDMLPNS